MSFLKKLTRSRASSYVDDDDYDDDYHGRGYDPGHPPTSYRSLSGPYDHIGPPTPTTSDSRDSRGPPQPHQAMFPLAPQNMQPQNMSYQQPLNPSSARSSGVPVSVQNGMAATSRSSRDGFVDIPPMNNNPQQQMTSSIPQPPPQQRQSSPTQATSSPSAKLGDAPAPDLLTRAFNEAVRPFTEKIEQLEQQVNDMQALVDQLEQQRLEIYAWIDKRGLRPDVPPEIAKQMDATPDSANALNAQLDRKITIVNFDLHRLQDDLNDSISSSHFASAMSKFIPDIRRLAVLPQGPRYAYELIIKLVGNLNSHGGLESNRDGTADEHDITNDRAARQGFYEHMDEELIDVVNRRSQDGEDWAISREIKRLEKNAAYLKNLGIEPYFPRTLESMRQIASSSFVGSQNTPPRYSDSSAAMPMRTSMQK